MFDRSLIGHCFEPYEVVVEKGFLKLFAKAIGETDRIYSDEIAAQEAGYRSILAPPTYVCCLQGLAAISWPAADLLGFSEERALHGGQAFEYMAPICAGDHLTLTEEIVDIFDKKDGELNFVVTQTNVRDDASLLVATSTETIIVTREKMDE